MSEPQDPIRENEAVWDAWTMIHEASEFYDLEGFRWGGIRLRDEEVAAVGAVRGKSLLDLQCHFGISSGGRRISSWSDRAQAAGTCRTASRASCP